MPVLRRAWWRYGVFEPLASLLPFAVLRWIGRRWKLCMDPSDGWTFWLGADYLRWVRHDKRRNAR